MTQTTTLVVGIGSPHGDDCAGWTVAELLAMSLDQNDARVEKAASPIRLLDWLDSVEHLILVDACRGTGRCGEVRRWVWPASELINVAWTGTHDFSLTACLRLAEHLGRLPRNVVIWSIEALPKHQWDAMSPEVAEALPRLVRSITCEIDQITKLKAEACTNNHS